MAAINSNSHITYFSYRTLAEEKSQRNDQVKRLNTLLKRYNFKPNLLNFINPTKTFLHNGIEVSYSVNINKHIQLRGEEFTWSGLKIDVHYDENSSKKRENNGLGIEKMIEEQIVKESYKSGDKSKIIRASILREGNYVGDKAIY